MFRLAVVRNRAALLSESHWYDLASVSGDESLADPMVAIARHGDLHAISAGFGSADAGGPLEGEPLGLCVPRPRSVFAIGLNYRKHAEESNMAIPAVPLTFTKFPSCLAGPGDEIVLSGDRVDWEVEVVALIGTGGRHIAAADAWSHVAGLTVGQDISDRTVQFAATPPQFSLGKSFDTYGPIGPCLVSVDSFPNPDDVGLWCEVAGEQMQSDRTSDLIFSVPQLIEYLSSICTLTAGDLIFTGTPSGVGAGRGRFLAAGEVVTTGADVIGTISNRCVAR